MMSLGCLIFAVGFNIFIFPLEILTGGVTGISIIINKAYHIAPAYSQWALNIPLFFWGWMQIGNRYAAKIIYGSFFLPFLIKVTEDLSNHQFDFSQPTSVILGAIFLGLGLGLILDANGSTGGLDIPARIISQSSKISLGAAIGIVDSFVIITGMISFQILDGTGIEKGLYALLFVFVMTLMIDLITILKPGHNMLRSILKRLNIIK